MKKKIFFYFNDNKMTSAKRNDSNCWLLGQVCQVISEEWLTKFSVGDSLSDEEYILAFTGKHMLPTSGQVLKLMMFYKKSSSMKQKSTGDIADLVVSEVNKYWAMANIPTIAKWLIKKHVVKLFEQYQALIKNNKRTTDTEIQKREIFFV